jgi:hypothetical protein
MIKLTQEKYNGWTNRETWLVNLYFGHIIDNNVQEYMYNTDTEEHRQVTQSELASYIEELFDCIIEDEYEKIHSFLKDMIDFSLIDWMDLAEQHIEEDTL